MATPIPAPTATPIPIPIAKEFGRLSLLDWSLMLISKETMWEAANAPQREISVLLMISFMKGLGCPRFNRTWANHLQERAQKVPDQNDEKDKEHQTDYFDLDSFTVGYWVWRISAYRHEPKKTQAKLVADEISDRPDD
jgi:hypothetical protein